MNEGISTGSPSLNPAGELSKAWVRPAVGAIACLALGVASGYVASSGPNDWYDHLVKAPGQPPPWLFGPVWSVLYILMGVSAGILANHQERGALGVFVFQFALNLLWTPVFFGAHRPDYAFGIIALLWSSLLVTVYLAYRVRPLAGWLLAPYLAWVSYATYLNAGVFALN